MKSAVKAGLLIYTLATPALALAAWDAVIDWAQRTELSTATSGVVETVAVRAGERVAKGSVLLRLEQGALRAAVDQGKSAMAHMKLLREEANRELERAEELYARTLLADHDLDLAKIAYAEAEADYQRSRAGYHQALEALRHSELRAPFDAMIIERRVQPAEAVVSELRAEPLLVVAASGKSLARFTVSRDELGALSLGQTVTVETSGKRHEGSINAISLVSADKNGTFTVEAQFATDAPLMPGLPATVSRK